MRFQTTKKTPNRINRVSLADKKKGNTKRKVDERLFLLLQKRQDFQIPCDICRGMPVFCPKDFWLIKNLDQTSPIGFAILRSA